MQITKIRRQKRKETSYSVYLDGAFAFSLADETLVKLNLKEGMDIDPEEFRDVLAEDEKKRAIESAWTLLHYRPRSRKEMAERLKMKSYSAPAVDHVLHRLGELGYLDDGTFAKQWVTNRLQEGKGPEFIKMELLKKGISREIIAEVLAEHKGSPEIRDRLKTIARRKLDQMDGVPPRDAARRLTGFLARRGFSIDEIRSVLGELRKDLKEDDEEHHEA